MCQVCLFKVKQGCFVHFSFHGGPSPPFLLENCLIYRRKKVTHLYKACIIKVGRLLVIPLPPYIRHEKAPNQKKSLPAIGAAIRKLAAVFAKTTCKSLALVA
jgi:hypothetical protein